MVAEPESTALGERLAGQVLVGSALLVAEVTRTVHRTVGRTHDDVLAQVLGLIDLLVVDRAVLAAAGSLPPATLCTLDAVHLASALALAERLGAFISYDDRLGRAADGAGLPLERPG